MEAIIDYVATMDLDIENFLKTSGMLIIAPLLLALVGRFIFGKKSTLVRAVSSAIGILFIYALTITLANQGDTYQKFIAPLPFVTIENDTIVLFNFQADYTVISAQVLSMIILSFLMNLVDWLLPTGKNIFVWLLFRCIAVIAGLVAHLIAIALLERYLPEGLMTYAPAILLGILVLLLLTGSLKFLVGLVLTSVNPLIAALYTFFFANVIGKQITKAILTTGILTGLVWLLLKLGIFAVSVASAALIAYIPLLIALLLLWYLIGKLL